MISAEMGVAAISVLGVCGKKSPILLLLALEGNSPDSLSFSSSRHLRRITKLSWLSVLSGAQK